MPPSDIFAFAAPGVPWFDIPTLIGPIYDERPIPEDLRHVVSTEPLSCDRGAYVAPALSTLHPTRPGFYFTGDSDHKTEDIGDVLTWLRQWANIPASYSRAAGTYAYRFPGLPSGLVGSPAAITAMSPSSSAGGFAIAPVFTSAAHGFSVGDRLYLTLNYSGATNPRILTVTVTAVTTNTFSTPDIWLFAAGTGGDIGSFVSGTASELVIARSAKTLAADAIEVFTYALPGVTPGIATAADFRPTPVFEPVVTATGEETDTLSASTTPTATDYRAQVTAGGYLVAESGISVYLGKILVRRDLMVRYL